MSLALSERRKMREERSLRFDMAVRGARTPLADRLERRAERSRRFKAVAEGFEEDKAKAVEMLERERREAITDGAGNARRERRRVLLFQSNKVREKPVSSLPQCSPSAKLSPRKEFMSYQFPPAAMRNASDDKENVENLKQKTFPAAAKLQNSFQIPTRRFPGMKWTPPRPKPCLRPFSTSVRDFPCLERFKVELDTKRGLGVSLGWVAGSDQKVVIAGFLTLGDGSQGACKACGKIQVGDKVVSIDGQAVLGNIEKLTSLIHSRKGELITLELERPALENFVLEPFTVTRNEPFVLGPLTDAAVEKTKAIPPSPAAPPLLDPFQVSTSMFPKAGSDVPVQSPAQSGTISDGANLTRFDISPRRLPRQAIEEQDRLEPFHVATRSFPPERISGPVRFKLKPTQFPPFRRSVLSKFTVNPQLLHVQ